MDKNLRNKKNTLSKHYQDFIMARSWLEDGDETFIDQAKALLSNGWNPNEQNEHGDTLLHIAVRNNKWKSLEWLINEGGNCFVQNKHGHTPVWLARRKNERFFPLSFKEIYYEAKDKGLLEEKTTIINTDITINKNENKNNVVDLKHSNHGNGDENINKWTTALENGDSKTVKQMLFSGLNLEAFNDSGRTPLHEAINRNDWELVEYLINYGAKFLNKDADGKTCLEYVEKKWNEQDPQLDIYSYEMVQFALKDEKSKTLTTEHIISSNTNQNKTSEIPANNKRKKDFKPNKKPQKPKVNFVMDQNIQKIKPSLNEHLSEETSKAPLVVIKKTRKMLVK